MRYVILFRHGKSDWDADTGSDIERPLAPRGRKAARLMGRFLSLAGQVPPRALTSPAERAARTLELAAEAGHWRIEAEIKPRLYDASVEDVLEELRGLPDNVESVLLVGHQPTWSETVAALCGGGRVRFPTAAMAKVGCAVTRWADVGRGCGELLWFVPPKLFSKGDFDF